MQRAFTCGCILVGLLSSAGAARADGTNVMGGIVLGFAFGHGRSTGLVGIEGGGGIGPERANVGLTYRLHETFVYAELDPWWMVGASAGLGYGTVSGLQPVVGIWEGLPISLSGECEDGWHGIVSISVGYRYTGAHEIYLAPKAGAWDSICFGF